MRFRINELQTHYSGNEHDEITLERMRENKNDEERHAFFYVERLATMDSKDVWACLKKCLDTNWLF